MLKFVYHNRHNFWRGIKLQYFNRNVNYKRVWNNSDSLDAIQIFAVDIRIQSHSLRYKKKMTKTQSCYMDIVLGKFI